MLEPLQLPLLPFHLFVLFFELSFHIFAVSFESLHDAIVPLLDGFDISCLQFGHSLFDIDDLQLIFALDGVNLLPEHGDLSILILFFLLVFIGFFAETIKQLGDFVILDGNHLLEAIQLNAEQFILIIHALLQILQLEIEYLFELVSKFVQLFTLLLVGFVTGDALLLDEFLETSDLFILLVAHLLHPALDHSFDVLLLGKRLLELSDLELVPFFLLQELLPQTLHLTFLVEVSLLPSFHHEGDPLLFRLLSLHLPLLDLPLQFQPLLGPIFHHGGLLTLRVPQVLDFSLFLREIFIFLIELILQVGVLFEDEFVLQFEVFRPAESDAGFIEILLQGVAVVLESIDLAFEEVDVVFGGRVAVDAGGKLLLDVAQGHNGNIINYWGRLYYKGRQQLLVLQSINGKEGIVQLQDII